MVEGQFPGSNSIGDVQNTSKAAENVKVEQLRIRVKLVRRLALKKVLKKVNIKICGKRKRHQITR
jgi:hypothetical protein